MIPLTVAIKWGGIMGIFATACGSGIWLAQIDIGDSAHILANVSIILLLLMLCVPGFMVGWRTQSISDSAAAGIIAGTIYATAAIIYAIFGPAIAAAEAMGHPEQGMIWATFSVSSMIAVLLWSGIGATASTAGGLIGRAFARRRPVVRLRQDLRDGPAFRQWSEKPPNAGC